MRRLRFDRRRKPRGLKATQWLFTGLLLLAPATLNAVEVRITRPEFGVPVFGQVEVIAEIGSEDGIIDVEIFLDGISAGRLENPPYRWTLDVGDENVGHRFEVVARDATGEEARDVVITPAIQVDQEIEVELQQLYVTVTRGGDAAPDLDRGDFTVIDDGIRQQLVTFERGDVPLAALLLIDSSDSMRGERLRLALAGARSFVDGVARLDQAMLILFADSVVHSTPFSGSPQVLASGLDGVEAGGGTALCDHLYAAIKLLEDRQGRRVVILLSDGVDTTSVLEMPDLLWATQRSQALVYWLRLPLGERPDAISSAWRDGASHRRELERLEALVRRSGGRTVPLRNLGEATAAFTEILEELRGQYVLGYYPEPRRNDGRWRNVRVRAGPGVKIRAREGYIDY